MSKSWYYQHDDQIQGPYTLDEMRRLASEGMLDPTALILELGDSPEKAKTAREVLGPACFGGGAVDALSAAGLKDAPAKPAKPALPKKKDGPAAKVTLRIRKKSKKPRTPLPAAPLEPIPPEVIASPRRGPEGSAPDLSAEDLAEYDVAAYDAVAQDPAVYEATVPDAAQPPLAVPVEDPLFGDVPLAEPIADALVDPLDFLIGDRRPPSKPKRIEPKRTEPPRSERPQKSPARPVAPKPTPAVVRPAAPKAPVSPPQVPFMEAIRKARFLVDVWLDEDENRDLVRTGDVELIREQPGIDAIFLRYEEYGLAFDDMLRQHLSFTTENRARYYNARPNG